jgi:hypothetical protein
MRFMQAFQDSWNGKLLLYNGSIAIRDSRVIEALTSLSCVIAHDLVAFPQAQ